MPQEPNSMTWGAAMVLLLMVIGAWNIRGIDLDLRLIAISVVFLALVIAGKG